MSDLRTVSEKFDVTTLRGLFDAVVSSVTDGLAKLGYEYPNETPDSVLDDMCDETLLDVMCKTASWRILADVLISPRESELNRLWTYAVKCNVVAEMYVRLEMYRESVKWQKRTTDALARFDQFGF